MSSRRSYYLLPAIPAAAVLIATHIHMLIRCDETIGTSSNSRKRGVFIYGLLLTFQVFISGALLVFVSGSVLERLNSVYLYPSGVITFVLGAVLLVVAIKKKFSAVINIFTTFLVFLIMVINLSLPAFAKNLPLHEFAEKVNEKTVNQRVALFMVDNAKLIYELEHPPHPCISCGPNTSPEDSVKQLVKETVPGDFILLEKRKLSLLSSLNYKLVLEELPNPSYVKVEWKNGPRIVPNEKRIKRKTLILLRILNHDTQ